MRRCMFPIWWAVGSSLLLGVLIVGFLCVQEAFPDTGTEFAGAILTVDVGANKFAVKKESGGTRFTFVATDKTQFEGGPKSIKDLKKDDKVVVLYQVQGPQYLALKVTKK